ncbi:hypothetical protein HHK36_032869 [Tetracentron sinense]|uniref:Neprosin PEP catalytic domain-containing protein n=1 Tax=Tetracentron sinense TaxID=13715 RepID=A0A834Y7D6_TETSI|nr:hypothetical protein HHK36_032869 [Tetracentron sinense]
MIVGIFMAARDSKKAVLLAFITVSFILSRNGVEGRRRLSKEEDLELYRQLKVINKPAVKSIQAAVLEMTGENYGAKAHLNAWGPKVSIGQFSFASIWALNGDNDQTNIIQAGWGDHSMGNWWLVFGDEHVGYWPKSIFTSLANGASKVAWGGEVSGPLMEASPPMGSGHFPQEGFNRSCFINRIQVADQSENFINPDDDNLSTFSDDPSCYNIMNGGNRGDEWGNFIYFGGPGLCKIS